MKKANDRVLAVYILHNKLNTLQRLIAFLGSLNEAVYLVNNRFYHKAKKVVTLWGSILGFIR